MPLIREIAHPARSFMRSPRSLRNRVQIASAIAGAALAIGGALSGREIFSHTHYEGHGFRPTNPATITARLEAATAQKFQAYGKTGDAVKIVPVYGIYGNSPYYGAARVLGDPAKLHDVDEVLFIREADSESLRGRFPGIPMRLFPLHKAARSSADVRPIIVRGVSIDAVFWNDGHVRI